MGEYRLRRRQDSTYGITVSHRVREAEDFEHDGVLGRILALEQSRLKSDHFLNQVWLNRDITYLNLNISWISACSRGV
jgi:hypothetical protein